MKTRKLFALIISLLICLSTVPLFASSQEIVKDDTWPESSHPYQDNCEELWTYYSPVKAQALAITFSEDSWVEDMTINYDYENLEVIDIKDGDAIIIYDENGEEFWRTSLWGSLMEDALASKTLVLPGSSFSVKLISDSSVNGYGFSFDKIVACNDEEINTITYEPNMAGFKPLKRDYTYTESIYLSDYLYADDTYDGSSQHYILSGWSDVPGGALKYDLGGEIELEQGEDITLYGVWTKLLLTTDEIYSFSNSYEAFDVDGNMDYYMTDADYRQMMSSIFKIYGPGPLSALSLAADMARYPKEVWGGSCFGLASTVALQHSGKLDLPAMQNVDSVSELKPDKELISLINYYQAQASTEMLCEKYAAVTTPRIFANQLEAMCNSIENGNVILFSYWEDPAFMYNGHAILLTGIYTDTEGNHWIAAYDNNEPEAYNYGYGDTYFITFFVPADYSEMIRTDYFESVPSFSWTDDFSALEVFNIKETGTSLSWYRLIIENILNFFRTLFTVIFK